MRLFSLPLLIFFALATQACADTAAYDACADVSCSGHGTCVMQQETPTCRCDPGFSPAASGWLCIDTSAGSPCAGVTCSGHGTCVALGGSPACNCSAGYKKSADGLSCQDPCKGTLCSGVGTCFVKSGKARCSCPAGYWITSDGTGCESSSMGGQSTYYLVYDRYPTWYRGLISIDSRKWSSGILVERTKYNMYLDSGGRGLHRTAMQTWSLTPTGEQVTGLQLEDSYTQGKLNRRRRLTASFSKGSGSVSMQRLEKVAAYSVKYKGAKTPVPMFGGAEYPGWTIGCLSPTFYALALHRFDREAAGEQTLEVFWPTIGAVGEVAMKAHPNWTAANPVIHVPDLEIVVTYDKDTPKTIHLEAESMTLFRTTAPAADLNLAPAKSAAKITVKALPTAGKEMGTSISSKDGTKLAGTLTLPKAATAKVPALLMAPGPWALDRDHPHLRLQNAPLHRHLAAHMAQAGYASLRYDPRGTGESGGKLGKANLAQLVDDAEAALKVLRSNSSVDPSRVFVLSHGAGSPVAVGLLARAGNTTRGYIGLSPFITNMKEALVHRYTAHIAPSLFTSNFLSRQRTYYRALMDSITKGNHRKDRLDGLSLQLWKDLLAFDGAKLLTSYPGEVLLVRGDQDLESAPDQLPLTVTAFQKAGRDITATTLADRTFILTEGKSSTLWETAFLPLELPKDSLDVLLAWLKANK